MTATLRSKSRIAKLRRIIWSPYVTGACDSSIDRNLTSSSADTRPRFGIAIARPLLGVRRTKNSSVSFALENWDHGYFSSTDSDFETMPSSLKVTVRGSCIPKAEFQKRRDAIQNLVTRQNAMNATVASAPIHSWLAMAPPAPITTMPTKITAIARFVFGEAPSTIRRHSSNVSWYSKTTSFMISYLRTT